MPLEVVRDPEIEEFGHPAPAAKPKEPIDQRVLQVIGALTAALAVRAILALAVVGSFVLAILCIQNPQALAIWIFGTWTLTVIGPLVWLAARRT